jgi:hypothetical protein
MKNIVLATTLSIVVLAAPHLWAQEKAKPAEAAKPAETGKTTTPLRVQVLFTEYDGEKKISSLPYTFLVNADDLRSQAAVRMGLRVPIEISSNTGVKQIQYQDIGTNLDGRAEKADNGRFLLRLGVERSSVYSRSGSVGGNEVSTTEPTIQQFRTQVELLIRDGQTIESTVATDPVTGRVLKVNVTLNVIN